ncbi:MAG: PAS domain S-box protein, partial [Ferruginibacter sp.]
KIAIEKDYSTVALLESEQKYRTLVDQASDAIFIADVNGQFITVNSSAARLSQFTVEELQQKNFSDFALMEDLKKNPYHFEELRAGKTVVTERLMKRRDGSVLDIEITAKLLSDGRLLVFVRDISERKKADKIIKDSEARYRAFFENSMDGILLGAPDGAIYAANPAACYIYGRSEEELCAAGRSALFDPNDSSLDDFLEERKQTGRTRKELMQKRKDGSLFPAEISSSIFTDSQGEQRTIILIRDISDRVRANNEILKEKNLSDSIINSLPGVFYLYSYDWKFIRWNRNFEERTGYSSTEIEKMHPLEFFSPDDHLDITDKIKNVFVTGEEKAEIMVSTKTGDRFPYFLTGKLIDYEGKPSLLGIGFDISERLKAQEEVRQTNEQLRLLTSHLQQVREEERKRIAREIHDELGQQLTAIKMDVAWMDKNTSDENGVIKNKLKNIIGLLDSSNLSVRHILKELRMGVLDDYGLVEALQWLGRQFSSNTGIPVTFTSTESIIKADENISICIFRVYQEALTNITKHAAAGNVWGSLTCENGFVCLSIKDDGKGFDPDTLKNNFTFGIIGLKERVTALRGVFELSSSPGNGTVITVKIPV